MNPHNPKLSLRVFSRGLAGISPEVRPVVLIKNNKLAAMGEAALTGPADEELRLDKLWLSPAPMDTHVHLHFRGDPWANHSLMLRAGLAAVRDLGRHPRDQAWREDAGALPRVRWAGVGMSATGPGRYWLSRGFAGPEQFAKEAERLATSGVTVLKVFASGLLDFDRPGEVCHPRVVSQDEIAAVVAVGQKHGIPVSVHVNGDQGVADCIRAGVDSIEHGYFMSSDTLTKLAQSRIAWCPTLVAIVMHAKDPEGRHDRATQENLWQIVNSQRENMRFAEKLNVNLVMGSDSGSYCLPHYKALRMEAESWLETGLKPETVYEACTSRAARLLGYEGLPGRLQPGTLCILVATQNNPLQDPWPCFNRLGAAFKLNTPKGMHISSGLPHKVTGSCAFLIPRCLRRGF